jgi:hypothetical protein
MKLVQSSLVFSQPVNEGDNIKNFSSSKPGMLGAIELEKLQPTVLDPDIFKFVRINPVVDTMPPAMDKAIYFKNKVTLYGDPFRLSLLNDDPVNISDTVIEDVGQKFIDYLKNVPISAIGINFTFHCDDTQYASLSDKFLNAVPTLKKEITNFASTFTIIKPHDVKLNIGISPGPFELISGGNCLGLIIGFNYHKEFKLSASLTEKKEHIKSFGTRKIEANSLTTAILTNV